VYLAWQVVCEEYRQAIVEISLRTDAATTKAVAAVAGARDDKAAAENDMLRAFDAAAALRDAKAGQHLRGADFFDVLPLAWTELDLFEKAVGEAVESAEAVMTSVTSAMSPPPPVQFNIGHFHSWALEATGALDDLKNDTKRVKELFTTYQTAKDRVGATRDAQKRYTQVSLTVARLPTKCCARRSRQPDLTIRPCVH